MQGEVGSFELVQGKLLESFRRIDVRKLVRFSVVGATVAAVYAGLFLILRTRLGLSEIPASLIAFGIAVAFQYVVQTVWTFRSSLAVPGQARRFFTAIAIGAVTSTAITGWIGPYFGWADAVSAAIVVVWLPIQNFILFSAWVYKGSGGDRTRKLENGE